MKTKRRKAKAAGPQGVETSVLLWPMLRRYVTRTPYLLPPTCLSWRIAPSNYGLPSSPSSCPEFQKCRQTGGYLINGSQWASWRAPNSRRPSDNHGGQDSLLMEHPLHQAASSQPVATKRI